MIHFAGVGDVQTDLFLPGQYDREDVLRCAETFLNGNTDYETPLREALRLMEQEALKMPTWCSSRTVNVFCRTVSWKS